MKTGQRMLFCLLPLTPLICESQTIAIGSQITYEGIKSRCPSNSVYVAYDVQIKHGDSFSSIYSRVVIDHRNAAPGFLPENTRDYYMPVQQYHMLYDISRGSGTGIIWGVEHYIRPFPDSEPDSRLREMREYLQVEPTIDKIPPNHRWKGFRTQYANLDCCHSNSLVCSYKDDRLFSVTLYDRSKAPTFPVRRSLKFDSDEIDLRDVRVMLQRNRNTVPEFECWWKTNTVIGTRFRTETNYKKYLSQWNNSSLLSGEARSFYARLDGLFPAGPTEVKISYFPSGFEGYIYQDEAKIFRFTTIKTPLYTMLDKENLRDIFINCRILPRLKRIRITDDETIPLDLASCSQNAHCKLLTKTLDDRNFVFKYRNCALLFLKGEKLAYVLYGAFGSVGEPGAEERLEGIVYQVLKVSGDIPFVCGLHEINCWR